MTLAIGNHLDRNRYQIIDRLGQGGMGAVYLATDQNFPDTMVAIKENTMAAAPFMRQFEREAGLLRQLNHPNLARVTNYFTESSGRQYLVMDFIAGDDLMQILRNQQRPLDESDVLRWMDKVMDAVNYMHQWRDPQTGTSQPILHRDIKPSNIKRTPNDEVFLVDFGLAKHEDSTYATVTGARGVTPGFSPPEQYEGGTTIQSDVYSIGATMYGLLTNTKLPTAVEIASGKQLIPPRQLNPQMGRNTERVILKAMNLQASERYKTIDEMQRALHNSNMLDRLPNFRPPTSSLPAGVGSTRRQPAFLRAIITMLSVAIVGLFGYILFTQFGSFSDSAPTDGATPLSTTSISSGEASADSNGRAENKSEDSAAASSPDASQVAGKQGDNTDENSANNDQQDSAQAVAAVSTATNIVENRATDTAVPATNTSEPPTSTPTDTSTPKPATATPTDTPDFERTEQANSDKIETRVAATLTARPTNRPTRTPTAKPTSTPTVEPTDKPTRRPTHTPTSKPATDTPVPATKRPATRTPTPKPPTNTPEPPTPTRKPATPTARPTSTQTDTPVPPTPTRIPPTSTPTFTPIPPTRVPPTSTPTFTAVPPTATYTPLPPPTFTFTPPPPAPTFTPIPPVQPAAISGSVTLLAPANGASSDQNTTFSWQPDFVLTAGQGFELIFWPKGTDPMRDGRGPIGSGTSTSARVDPKAAQNAGLPIGAELFWGVRLVELNPYRPVKLLGVSRTFTFSGGGSSGGSSDNGGSNCVGFACDDR